jgi:type VI secretion system protein ImpC
MALEQPQLVASRLQRPIEAIVAQLDKKLTEQINVILHHEVFQRLEGTWRGLWALVSQCDERIKIRVLNISKSELGRVLETYQGLRWRQSPVFTEVYEKGCGDFVGEPFGCLVGDYYFAHTLPDVELLRNVAYIMQAAQCVFIAGASPILLRLKAWEQFASLRRVARTFSTPEYAAWRGLRQSEASRYLALTLPRTLARRPYGARYTKVEEFDFEEDFGANDPSRYCWTNSAYQLAINVGRSYSTYGWGSRIRGLTSGGAVHGLPVHTFPTDDGSVGTRAGVETSISEARESEVSECGLIALVQRQPDSAVFASLRSVNEPVETDNAESNINAQLSARLPYVLACCRFSHQLGFVVRDKFQSVSERAQLQTWLQAWLDGYVIREATPSVTASAKPLSTGRVTVTEVERDPSRSLIEFTLRPRHQPNGLSVSVRLASEVRRPG